MDSQSAVAELQKYLDGGGALSRAAVRTVLWDLAEARANHDADVRTVVALMDAAGALPMEQFDATPDVAAATNALYAQFEDRIDEADRRKREGTDL